MSVQAGIWNFDGKPVDRTLLGRFSEALKQQGPDGEFYHVDGSIALLYRPFHTTAESRREKQPYVSRRGFVITWDGRLDNREELKFELGRDVRGNATDVSLFSAAFDRWESECFRRIIGDWAVSIWKPQERELIFACDFMAIKHIFYYLKRDSIWWATELTPLVLLSGDKFHIDDEYIAGYFANDPEAHLTPYREMRQVPPGHFIHIRNGAARAIRFWRFSPKSRVRYKTDAEYEEHFRHVFRQSVRCRLRSNRPIIAELSGGLDSSSIVCFADDILAKEGAQTPRVDTLSYYDNTEPNGDDWIYFQRVEQKRNRVGVHIDASKFANSSCRLEYPEFSPFPGYFGSGRKLEAQRGEIVRDGNYRVVLSGIGGDEFMGGNPDPRAQIADLIIQCRLFRLAKQLIAWSLVKRKPCTHLLYESIAQLLPTALSRYVIQEARIEPWIQSAFARRTNLAKLRLRGSEYFGLHLPTRRSTIGNVLALSNRLAKWRTPAFAIEEVRYPYLDRNLIEFVLAIPATQFLRPGERRSLMRRSFAGIVPGEILSRRTKQFTARTPVLALESCMGELLAAFQLPLSSQLGYVNQMRLLRVLDEVRCGKITVTTSLLQCVSLEFWLRSVVGLCSPGCSTLAVEDDHDRQTTRFSLTVASGVTEYSKKGGQHYGLHETGSCNPG